MHREFIISHRFQTAKDLLHRDFKIETPINRQIAFSMIFCDENVAIIEMYLMIL